MFWKKGKKREESGTPKEFGNVDAVGTPNHPAKAGATGQDEKQTETGSGSIDMSKFRNFEHGVLKGFYISEKATGLQRPRQGGGPLRDAPLSQYVFKVFDGTTKNEVKKQVERNFSVKVKGVKIINLPRKSRTIGHHAGFKPGFKKAIVVLEKGYTIDQAMV